MTAAEHVRRSLLLGLFGLLALLATSTPAGAADRYDRIAAQLRQSDLGRSAMYVGPESTISFDDQERTKLRAALRASTVPIYLVVVPLSYSDETDGRGTTLLHNLHDRIDRPGIYLTVEDDGPSIAVLNFGVPRKLELPSDLLSVEIGKEPDRPLSARLLTVLEHIESAPTGPKPTPERLYDTEPDSEPSSGPEDLPKLILGGFFLIGPMIGGLLYLAVWSVGTVVRTIRRRGQHDPDAPGEQPSVLVPDPHAPSGPDERRLRALAEAEAERLKTELAKADGNPARLRAITAYDAVLLLLQQPSGPPDLVGATVLARDGRMALATEDERSVPPCLVNPLHGPSNGGDHRILPPGPARPADRVPVCSHCADADRHDLRWRVLALPGEKGPVEHFAWPGFWTTVRYGADEADLPRRTLEYLGVE